MFYSDRAIGSQSEDKLNRSGFARLLAKTLVNLNSEDTFTVGLFGKWGSGKTSIVNMTLSEIDGMQSQKYLDQRKSTSWLSNSSRSYAEHMMLDVIERIPSADRLAFFTVLISDASLDARPSIAVVINLLELAYGRLAANGQIRDYKRVLTLEELLSVEQAFTSRIKKLLATNSLFDFYDWRMVYHLLDSFDHDYVSDYLEKAFKQDENVLHFLGYFITIWIGSGREYEVKKGYLDFFSTERVLTAIESCRQSGAFFKLTEDLQFKCAAFCIAHSEDQEKRLGIYQDDVEALIRSWKQ